MNAFAYRFHLHSQDDPKHVRTEMRVTRDMLDLLGGKSTATFEIQSRV